MSSLARAVLLASGLIAAFGCARPEPDPRSHGSAAVRLKPAVSPLPQPRIQRTVYVPVYSSIYLGLDVRHSMIDLAATVSVRNVSMRHALVLEHVRYYDSDGKLVRDYVTGPAELAPLATVEFVIQQMDVAGGPGANCLVQWSGVPDIDEPLVEAVMVGRSGNAGISFTSAGRPVRNGPLP